jgi:hypothetical protein
MMVATQPGWRLLKHDGLYNAMATNDNQFGPVFTAVKGANLSDLKSFSQVRLPDIVSTMPSRFMQPHIIHPALFDALRHVHDHQFQLKAISGSTTPTFYAEVTISANITSKPGDDLGVVADLSNTCSYSTGFDLVAFQKGRDGEPVPVLTVTRGGFRQIRVRQESEIPGVRMLSKWRGLVCRFNHACCSRGGCHP